MKNSWAQPSLSRDFTLLSAAVLFVLLLVSTWVTYTTYDTHFARVRGDLEKESNRIDRSISMEMENVEYMLSSLGRQIAIDPNRDLTKLAQSLKSFDTKGHVYSIFTWTNNEHKMVVSSNKGVLDEPVDISDRDFIQEAAKDSWKMHIGRPVEGRVSKRWIIPVGMGVTDYTGKFIGIISISIDINKLIEQISDMVKRDGISFALVSKTLIPIAEVSDDKKFAIETVAKKLVDVDFARTPSGFLTDGSLVWGTGSYSYYRLLSEYPYIVVMNYDSSYMDENVRVMLWSRLLQILVVAVFFVLFLWIVRLRVISPVLNMTRVVAAVARGKKVPINYKGGAVEMNDLAAQVERVSEYIAENKRVENELRHKMFQLKKMKENADIALHSKSEFLIYIAQEIRKPLSNMIGFSQIIKDQMYGAIEVKYRNYAEDIFKTGNQLIAKMQDVLLHSKMEAGYVSLQEKHIDIADLISAALRQMTDSLQAKKATVKVLMPEIIFRLNADEFRLQQIITNLLMVLLEDIVPESTKESSINLEVKIIGEQRDKMVFALIISKPDAPIYTTEKLASLAMTNINDEPYNIGGNTVTSELIDVRIGLVKLLALLHNGHIYIENTGEKSQSFVLFMPATRIILEDEA